LACPKHSFKATKVLKKPHPTSVLAQRSVLANGELLIGSHTYNNTSKKKFSIRWFQNIKEDIDP